MMTNDKKSDLSYLNKLIDEYNHNYQSIGKKPINVDYSSFSEKIEINSK